MTIKNIQTSHLVHDLKNPVNIIETGAKSLLDRQDRYGPLTTKQEKVVRRMLRNALKIRNLANSMLEVDMASMGIMRVCDCTLSGILKTAFIEVFDLVDPAVSDALEEAEDVETFDAYCWLMKFISKLRTPNSIGLFRLTKPRCALLSPTFYPMRLNTSRKASS